MGHVVKVSHPIRTCDAKMKRHIHRSTEQNVNYEIIGVKHFSFFFWNNEPGTFRLHQTLCVTFLKPILLSSSKCEVFKYTGCVADTNIEFTAMAVLKSELAANFTTCEYNSSLYKVMP